MRKRSCRTPSCAAACSTISSSRISSRWRPSSGCTSSDLDEKLIRQSLAAFYWLRELRGIEKKPSTSELVDWIRALVSGGVDPARIEKEIPFAGVLLKKDKDLRTLAEGESKCLPRFFTCCASGDWMSP